MARIDQVKSIGLDHAEELYYLGINTTEDLLEKYSGIDGIKSLSGQTRINEDLIQKWLGISDLLRINGLSEEFVELLINAKIDNTEKLSREDAVRLYKRLTDINKARSIVSGSLNAETVEYWIDQAKKIL